MSSPDQIDTATDGSSPPPGWRLSRLRFVIHSNPVKSEVAHLDADQPVSFVPMEAVGEYGGLQLEADKPIGDIYNGYTYFRDADVVIAKITPCFENGKGAIAAGLTNGIAFGTTELHVARALPDCEPRFLFYLSISDPFREIGTSEMFGAGGQKRVPEDFIKNYRAAIPSKGVQEAIAAFLDHKTADIDRLIETKRALIARLNEKRQALITHAVTRGLDDGVPMKDSGVPWLGEVPAHWSIRRFKFGATHMEQGWSPQCENRVSDEGEIGVLKVGCVNGGTFNAFENKRLPDEIAPQFQYALQQGDLLISRANTKELVGSAAVVRQDHPHLLLCDKLYRLRCDQSHLPEFLSLVLATPGVRYQIEQQATGASDSMQNIAQDAVKNLLLAIPPVDEQRSIVQMVFVQTGELSTLLKKLNKTISALSEYRSALITAAVTGQIDIRN